MLVPNQETWGTKMCPQTDKLSVVGRTLKLTKCQSQERPNTDTNTDTKLRKEVYKYDV